MACVSGTMRGISQVLLQEVHTRREAGGCQGGSLTYDDAGGQRAGGVPALPAHPLPSDVPAAKSCLLLPTHSSTHF